MIVGSVNAHREMTVRIVVVGPAGQEREIEAILDTGYTGWLTLPLSVVSDLDLPFHGRGSALLADGSESSFNIHEATVAWAGRRRSAAIHVVETEPLLGMGLLYGHELGVQVVAGGTVTLRELRLT